MLRSKVLGAILLIAGTAIGAGMLALPVSTSLYGFYPATLLFLISWFFMTYASFLMLEVNLWLPEGTNLISMAKKTTGKIGAVAAWLSYLLLLYALLSAYLSGLGTLFVDVLQVSFHLHIPNFMGILGIAFIGSLFLYLGLASIDFLNRFLMLGLIGTFLLMIVGLLPHFDTRTLEHQQFHGIWNSLPIIFATFGFQIIIPSLRDYLHSHRAQLKWAILIGSLIPLLVYIAWEFLILGIVPIQGENGLIAILKTGQPEVGLTRSLEMILTSNWIATAFQSFAAFAIATSFLGVSLSLFDFLGDAASINKRKWRGKIKLVLLTFLPPFIFATLYPHAFILALEYAGVFVAILLVLLPAIMVWRGRYIKNMETQHRTFGGKIGLISVMLFALSVIVVQFLK